MRELKYALFIFTFLCSLVAFGQKNQKATYHVAQTFPIIRDTADSYPKSMTVEGKIIDISTGVSCGVWCGCGTINIEITNSVNGYTHPNAFVAIPCFNVAAKDYLDKTININLVLLKKEDDRCFWNEMPMNYIDSKGIPFYIPDNLDEKLNIK